MGMQKGSALQEQVKEIEAVIKEGTSETKVVPRSVSMNRDFNAEARGKTMCALLQAALSSPGIAQLAMTADGLDPYMALVEKAADRAFKKVFPDEGK